jgi:hypothetical protein
MNAVGSSKPVMSTFALAVQELKNVSPNDLVAQLNGIFLSITRFSEDEVVAAYQTLALLEEVLVNDQGATVSKHLKTAVLEQMRHLAQKTSSINRTKVALRFHKITGLTTMNFL